jgi:hypothetical protein
LANGVNGLCHPTRTTGTQHGVIPGFRRETLKSSSIDLHVLLNFKSCKKKSPKHHLLPDQETQQFLHIRDIVWKVKTLDKISCFSQLGISVDIFLMFATVGCSFGA